MSDIVTALKDVVGEISDGLISLFTRQQRELITILRQPTPIKHVRMVEVDNSGSFRQQDLVELYTCPVSHEAWINRITITARGYDASAPLNTGQMVCTGSTAGEVIFFLPLGGTIAPIQITEGRLSATHLNPGESMYLQATGIPPWVLFRIDMQILLVSGVSPDTPRVPTPPSNIE